MTRTNKNKRDRIYNQTSRLGSILEKYQRRVNICGPNSWLTATPATCQEGALCTRVDVKANVSGPSCGFVHRWQPYTCHPQRPHVSFLINHNDHRHHPILRAQVVVREKGQVSHCYCQNAMLAVGRSTIRESFAGENLWVLASIIHGSRFTPKKWQNVGSQKEKETSLRRWWNVGIHRYGFCTEVYPLNWLPICLRVIPASYGLAVRSCSVARP